MEILLDAQSTSKSFVCQNTVHLLAKLRTRLLTPSNLIAIGHEVACNAHLVKVCNDYPKAEHGLTRQVLENKDKQNYSSIEVLLITNVEQRLQKVEKGEGILVYLRLMRNICDAFFDKSITPLQRTSLLWQTIFS